MIVSKFSVAALELRVFGSCLGARGLKKDLSVIEKRVLMRVTIATITIAVISKLINGLSRCNRNWCQKSLVFNEDFSLENLPDKGLLLS